MPASKKPRKKPRSKCYYDPTKMTPELKARMVEMFSNIALMAEMKLHRGECTKGEILVLCDWVNLAVIAVRKGARSWIDTEALIEAKPMFIRAMECLNALRERGERRGRFVCTGEELTVIRSVLPMVDEVVQTSIERCPVLFIREWMALQTLTKDKTPVGDIEAGVINSAIHNLINRQDVSYVGFKRRRS